MSAFRNRRFTGVHAMIMPIMVLVALVMPGRAAEPLSSMGVTEPVSDATLSAAVNGTVSAILRREGDAVNEGDIIVELENSVEALEVQRRKLVADSKARLDAAASRVDTLRIDLESTRHLYETTKSVSKDDLQKKELEFKLAEAEFEGQRTEEEREQIEYEMAVAQLDRKRVRAPFGGVVVEVAMEVGENCNPQQPLVRVVDVSKCRFITHIDSDKPWNLARGAEVMLSLQGTDGVIAVRGTVEYVSPVVDPSSGLQEVRVLFDNTEMLVRPGVNGTMTVVSDGN